ncbi:unnamed protein product [Closterium sp. NIES-65]|nr:unnamed protein product [Closterium sp. NIES-65]
MKALRAGSKEAASCPAIISVAGTTVDLPPERWKLLAEDKHPLTARLFDFVTGDVVDKKSSNASMLILLHPDHLSLDGDETWNKRFVRVAIPTGGAEHDATSLKGSCGNIACLFAFEKILAQLDAVAASGSGPQFSRPTAKTLNALRHEAYHTAEELAFNLSVDLTRPMHGGEAEGAETGNVHKEATGAQVADHGVLALTGAAGVSNGGGARGGTKVHADDEGAEDTATKGATRDEADRAVAREGEESSEEEAEAHVVAAAASSRPATSGKSIKHLAQHLAPGAGSAGPSGEVAGKSPVTGPRDYASLSSLPSHKLAAEILQLDCRLANLAEENARLKKRQESGVGGVAVVGSEELASALANAVRVLEKEARAIAQERAALVDTRNQEAVVLGRVDARLGQLQGVVTDSMEVAQKKLTDEVARKIDNMSTAVSATAERAITTSGVTNALHTLIALVGGAPPPRTDNEGTAATEIAEPGDAEHGKRAAGAKAENQRGAKRQRGPQAAAAVRNPSVQDMLKQKWGAASRGAAPTGQPGSSSRSIPPGEAAPKPPGPAGATASVTSTVGRGKGKAEDGEAPAVARSLASRREVQSAVGAAAEGRQTTLAPARAAITAGHMHSALASASPIAASVEGKAEKRGRGGKKLPTPPVYTIDEDDADEELEGLVSRGGPGLVSEPHMGGKKRWLGHGDREDLQYKTAIAMYPYDGKVDPGLNLSQKQIREWAADLSIAEGLHTGLLITMHYRNLVASKDRWQRMFDSYRGLTKPGMHTTNVIAWAAVVGKEAAVEEADLGDVEPTDYAGAIACAIAMVWEVTRGSNVTAAADNGNLAARAAGCYGERSRLFPVVSAYVINAVRKRNRREEDEPQVVADPKAVAAAIVSGVVSEVVAKSRDLRHIELAARETVDVIITWCNCSVAGKQMESLGLYLALPKDRLKKRT